MPKVPDFYQDTCLHAGVIADGVAQKLAPENPEGLSKTLELRIVDRYRNDAAFRAKLAPTLNHRPAGVKRWTDREAAAARDWLVKTVTRWGLSMLGKAGKRQGTVRINLEAAPELRATLKALEKDFGATSMTEVVRRGAEVLQLIVQARKSGGKIKYHHADGQVETIILI